MNPCQICIPTITMDSTPTWLEASARKTRFQAHAHKPPRNRLQVRSPTPYSPSMPLELDSTGHKAYLVLANSP